MSDPGSVPLTPDPRISTLRPAWLDDDDQWRDQLQAMERDDARWIEHQWEMAGGAKPAVDTSWITYELRRLPLGWPASCCCLHPD